jgi:hypothetical protein
MAYNKYVFSGRWISSGEFANLKPINVFHPQHVRPPEGKSVIEHRHILFRKKFNIEGADFLSLIRISADDYYKLYINGVFVTQGPCPGYPFHYYYNIIDSTPYLRQGENLIAVHTYYHGLINRAMVSGDERHGLLLDLQINGKTEISSDGSFLCHEHTGFTSLGKTGYNVNFLEQYDSASPETGFEQPGFDDSTWECACLRKNADWVVYPQPTRQLELEKIKSAAITKSPGRWLVDFGCVYVGYLLLGAKGRKGDTVVYRCGQELNDDGTVRYRLRSSCTYEETWLLSGGNDRLNQFDYKSFRYVEIQVPEGCEIDESGVYLLARHYPFTLKAECNSGEPKLRAVWNLCVHSLHYGVQDIIQDCMEREKGQYLGDGCYTSISHGLLTGDFSLFEKFIRDALRSSFINPEIMCCFPCSLNQEIAEYPLFMPLACFQYYHLTGNASFLREIFPGLRSMMSAYRDHYAIETGLLNNIEKPAVVEWPIPSRDGYDVPAEYLERGRVCDILHNVINAQYIGAVKFMNKVAAVIGEAPLLDAEPLVRAYQKAFYDPATGLFRDAEKSSHISVPGNAYALMVNLCPDKESEKKVIAYLRGRRLSGSMLFITYILLAGLVRAGEVELLQSLLADENGWLRMIREGATTTFEGWGKELKWDTSLFHLVLTYAVQFLTDWDMQKIFEGI